VPNSFASHLADWKSAGTETVGSWREMLEPKGIGPNIVAGITVAFVALPLNLALAIACGLPASVGLMTGAVVGLVGAFIGGSKLQITGPEVALAPLCLEIVTRHGFAGLLVATFLCGLVQVVFGLFRVGRLIHLMPIPVIGGFLAAVGVLVINAQLPRFLGLPDAIRGLHQIRDPAVFLESPATPVIGIIVVGVILGLRRLAPRAPGPLLAIGAGVGAMLAFGWSISTVPSFAPSVPSFGLPPFAGIDVVALWPEALALALLASIDSLLCAVSVDTATKARRHNSDQELVAQGVCNLLSSFVGGMPVAGAVVRSMAAVDAGATHRLAPIAQSIVLLGIFFLAAPLVAFVPIAGLAAVLLVVGARLVDVRALLRSWRVARFETLIFLATAGAIIATDFVAGVFIGLVLALVQLARHERGLDLRVLRTPPTTTRPAGVRVVAIHGPVCFASHTDLDRLAEGTVPGGRVVVDLSAVPFFDLTGLQSFRTTIEMLRTSEVDVVVVGARESVAQSLRSGDVIGHLSAPQIFASVEVAVTHKLTSPDTPPLSSAVETPWAKPSHENGADVHSQAPVPTGVRDGKSSNDLHV
jgi:sulfate permease, SulP family